MARIRYTGKEDKRIPGVGPVTEVWTACPAHIAEEFQTEPGFETELDVAVDASNKSYPSHEPALSEVEGSKTGGKKP